MTFGSIKAISSFKFKDEIGLETKYHLTIALYIAVCQEFF